MYQPPSGKQMNRRSSTMSSPHSVRDPDSPGQQSPSSARKLPQQPDATMTQSQEHENSAELNNAIHKQEVARASSSCSLSSCSVFCSPEMTDQDITHDIYNYILQFVEQAGVNVSLCFQSASMNPPVTSQSLSELDMPRIINNPKLRHDVNFDRELHFRPNLDGHKGRQKVASAYQYWKALEGELFMYGFAASRKASAGDADLQMYWHRVLTGSQQRLTHVFEVVRDILKTLVPESEQRSVSARLDVDLLMQEITNGVCDLVDLANWLSKMLKAHCAPMRDVQVEEMRRELEGGAMSNDHQTLVNGLRLLLTLLEAMKLDVANHQIRHMRPLLVSDTVNFQKCYNAHRIDVGKIDAARAKRWYVAEVDNLRAMGQSPSPLEALSAAVLRDIIFSEHLTCPQTFYLDSDRIRALRTELHIRIYHMVVREVFRDLVPASIRPTDVYRGQQALQQAVAALVGSHGRFHERLENIAVEIVRVILTLEGRPGSCDATLLDLVERRLDTELSCASPTFDKHAQELCDRLLPELLISVNQHIRLSAIDLQNAFVPNNVPASRATGMRFGVAYQPPGRPAALGEDEDAIRRLSHILCLHWQIWADLVYLAPIDEDIVMMDATQESTPPPSRSVSPMVPVAQAIYGPGKSWLPVGLTVTEMPVLPSPEATPSPGQHPTGGEQDDSVPKQSSIDPQA